MKKHLSKTKNFGYVCLITFLILGLQQVQAQQQVRKFQQFDIVQDYKGAKHLILHVLANFQQGTTKVTVSKSLNGKNWEEIGFLNIKKIIKHLSKICLFL